MSHQLIAASRRVTRSARRYTPPVRELQVDIDADVADQLLAPAAVPPPAAGRRSPASSRGGSDWEEEHELASDASSEESDIEDMDYVSLHNSSIDSDEPLSQAYNRALQKKIARNAPGTANFKWEKEENFPRRHGFSGTPGVQLGHLEKDSSPRELFDCFFTPTLWEMMALETNRYAQQKKDARDPPSASSHMKSWVDVDVEELQRYIGIRLLMGIHPLPSFRDHWSTHRLIGDAAIKKTMKRDRFDQITANLHFTNNEDPRGAGDNLWKIRPVVECFSRRFKAVYTPEKDVTVDESLFAYKGRHFAIQYNPNKRARWGYKCYKLCCSTGPAAGYTCAMRIYMCNDRGEVPASQKAVTDLMEVAGLWDKGYDLYTDNWYTSPTLFHYLQARRTNAAGTVRLNRKFMPKDLQVKKKGDMDYRSSNTGQLALSWKDKKQVNMLSTFHTGPQPVTLPPNHRGQERIKPKVVCDYNRCMGGVDLSDQMATSYRVVRKARKWYQNLFYHLVDTVVVNAYLVHKALEGTMSHEDFRLNLCSSLMPEHPEGAVARPRARRIPEGHELERIPKYRRCRHCKETSNTRKESKFACSVCNVALCAGECFYSYHH